MGSVAFPGVNALGKLNLIFAKGNVRALTGENYAGKSTLVSVVVGLQSNFGAKSLFLLKV